MGDARFDHVLDRVQRSPEADRALGTLTDVEVIEALAASSKISDPYWSNVLATEASNRTIRLQNVLEVLDRGVLGLDPRGRIIVLNESAERLIGRSHAKLRGEILHPLVHPDCEQGVNCWLAPERLGTSSAPLEGETKFVSPGSAPASIAFRIFPIKRDGETHGSAAFFWSTDPSPRGLTFYYSQARTGGALQNMKQITDRTGELIELVDVDKSPERAEAAGIIATPVLVRHSPLPERRVIGDMEDIDHVMHALDLPPGSGGGQTARPDTGGIP